MSLVTDRHQEVADWVAHQYGSEAPTVDAAIGLLDDGGNMIAGVFFDGSSGHSCFAHIAATRGLSIALMRAVARLVYEGWKMERLTFLFSADNTRVHRLVETMGAAPEARLKRFCGEHDALVYVLWRDAPFVKALLR